MSPWTLPVDLYPLFALGSSVVLLVIFLYHLRRITQRHRRGPGVVMALVLVVVGLGLVLSAFHAFNKDDELLHIGLSLVRGALLVGAVALLVADREAR